VTFYFFNYEMPIFKTWKEYAKDINIFSKKFCEYSRKVLRQTLRLKNILIFFSVEGTLLLNVLGQPIYSNVIIVIIRIFVNQQL